MRNSGQGLAGGPATDTMPDLPMDERTEDLDAWRQRMEAKSTRRPSLGGGPTPLAGTRPAGPVLPHHAPPPLPDEEDDDMFDQIDDEPPTGTAPASEPAQAPAPAPVAQPANATPKPAAPKQSPAATVDTANARALAIVTAYTDGDSMQDLAKRYEISYVKVNQIIREAGVEIRTSSQAPAREAIRVKYRDEVEALGLTSTTLREWADANGVTCSPFGFPPRAVLDAYKAAHPAEAARAEAAAAAAAEEAATDEQEAPAVVESTDEHQADESSDPFLHVRGILGAASPPDVDALVTLVETLTDILRILNKVHRGTGPAADAIEGKIAGLVDAINPTDVR